jgi:hypothetical protein
VSFVDGWCAAMTTAQPVALSAMHASASVELASSGCDQGNHAGDVLSERVIAARTEATDRNE